MNLYDFLYKNYKLQATEQPGPRLEDQSWIADPSEEPESMDMEGAKSEQAKSEQAKSDRPSRTGQVGAGPREKKTKKTQSCCPLSRN